MTQDYSDINRGFKRKINKAVKDGVSEITLSVDFLHNVSAALDALVFEARLRAKARKHTRADLIRAMNDDELAQFLEYEVMKWPCCRQDKPVDQETGECTEPDCRGCWLKWLKEVVE